MLYGKELKMSKNSLPDLKKLLLLVTSYALLVTSIGCEAFVRKFTRKPKRDQMQKEELVLAPEEYKGLSIPSNELYLQYFLFWKSWQDELIESLSTRSVNHKKQVSCVNEAIKNIQQARSLLKQEKKDALDKMIDRLIALKDSISRDVYGSNAVTNRNNAERIKRNIMRDFSGDKIKGSLL